MAERATLLEALGGEEGCRQLSAQFYGRVGKDPVLKPLFPGKSLRCATNEFAAFLIQFLGGDEDQTQHRWWLSLRESHARFQISPEQRRTWLSHMSAALGAHPASEEARAAFRQFFESSSGYVTRQESASANHRELASRWNQQLNLDDAVSAIVAGRDDEAIDLASSFQARPSVFAGLLRRMVQSGRPRLIEFVLKAAERDPTVATRRFGGSTLLHAAAGAGCLELITLLLRLGTDQNIQDNGRHTPLYRVANECSTESGPAIVRALVRAGADVKASAGVTRSTPLHMAARRGHVEIARALLELGAERGVRDTKGDTPLQRAINCRKEGVARLLKEFSVLR